VTAKGSKHGVYALKHRGIQGMSKVEKRHLRGLRRELMAPGGVHAALATRAALAVTMVSVLEAYIEAEVAAGTELADLPIVRSWPAFNNSAGRALTALAAAQDKPGDHDDTKRVLEALGQGGKP
jgi:hypothetical protein